MLIDDKLQKILVDSAEELGISVSILLDWCALNKGDIFASVAFKALRDGNVKIAGVRNQQPVFTLTEQGERFAADLRRKRICSEGVLLEAARFEVACTLGTPVRIKPKDDVIPIDEAAIPVPIECTS